MAAPIGDQSKPYERNREFFLPGGDLYLLVDNVVFRIHGYFFERDSAKFRAKLGAHIPPNQTRPGSSESNPIAIKNTSPAEFSKFLWIFYNKKYSDYSTATTADWTAILKIACENDFLEVQHCAIRGLQACDLTTVQRIAIYEMYRADKRYIVPLYVEMAMREQSPTRDEEDLLGDKTTLLIFRLREHLRSRPTTTFTDVSPLPAGIDDDEALRAVRVWAAQEGPETQRQQQPLRKWEQFRTGVMRARSTRSAKEDDVAHQKIPGDIEIGEKDVDRFVVTSHNGGEIRGVDLDHSVRSSQARANLVYFAASWTIVVFWGTKTIPYNLHIL
ncbi:hypothetical protein HYPSUDRAFT_50910 [Hypholoma sublateritium FD-334 SS-4]|uniref:BTB domain-containing protein n=1 Tax=Hypholoma sublateritium (strain FD-334 SS-4) TaxID=945553 RepID=A0A0D2QAS9_HYPSF|nr:hypothetical protein HYPSUDRAFT_50910 [Hypholoma sublateritium FD-334 SS-4]